MLGNGNYRRQSYVDLERNFLNTDSEIVEEFNGDSPVAADLKKLGIRPSHGYPGIAL